MSNLVGDIQISIVTIMMPANLINHFAGMITQITMS
jgi:hypothetical protein